MLKGEMNKTRQTGASQGVCFLEKVRIQGVEQWILVRGKALSNPVLLLIQAGPGLPMINEAERFGNELDLESEFTVVYWDQRGCGKSYAKGIESSSMCLGQLVRDTIEMTDHLKLRLGVEKLHLMGFSMGGTIALQAAAAGSERFSGVVAVGPDLDGADAGLYAYEFALSEARCRRNRAAERELLKIGPPPHVSMQSFSTRVKWVANFGGIERRSTYFQIFVSTMKSLLSSSHYSLKDIVRTVKGISFAQSHLVKDMARWNLFETLGPLTVPVALFQGRWDKAVRPDLAERFVEERRSREPVKLVWFEASAHNPQWEENAKFREELVRIKRAQASSLA